MKDPDDVAGLVLWLRADDFDVEFDDDDTITSDWIDASAEGNDAVPDGGVTYHSNAINGHSVVRFDGAGGVFEAADAATLDATTITVLVVAKVTDVGSVGNNPNGWFVFKNGEGPTLPAVYGFGRLFFASPGSLNLPFDAGSGWADNVGGTVSTGTFYVLSGRYDGSTWKVRINGSDAASGSVSGSIEASSGPLQIGGYNQSFNNEEYLNGDIAEVVMYDEAISANDLSAVESGLLFKYGL